MATLTLTDVPDDLHCALRVRASRHGRSTEAEIREILASALKPPPSVRMGDALAHLGRKLALTNEDFDVFERLRDKVSAEPLPFE